MMVNCGLYQIMVNYVQNKKLSFSKFVHSVWLGASLVQYLSNEIFDSELLKNFFG